MQEGTDRRLIILAVFALVAVGVVAAILIGRSGGEQRLDRDRGERRRLQGSRSAAAEERQPQGAASRP